MNHDVLPASMRHAENPVPKFKYALDEMTNELEAICANYDSYRLNFLAKIDALLEKLTCERS